MIRLLFLLAGVGICISGCGKSAGVKPGDSVGTGTPGDGNTGPRRAGSIGIIGDTADVSGKVESGIVLMGGGTDVDAAFKWMIRRCGGGDVVILRASGTDAYNSYVYSLGNVNSVETLKIDSRELADNDTVAGIIRNAEMLFIAGGDQSDYMHYWKGSKTADAINYLLKDKKIPVGGTSAGCAILSGIYYSGENGSVTSAQALQDPFEKSITLYNNDFLKVPGLSQVLCDQHFLTRGREGRMTAFLSRTINDWGIAAKAIAVDERTAVCIDKDGIAKVYGDYSTSRPYSYAYFVASDLLKQPETVQPGKRLTWNNGGKALTVYEIAANVNGGGNFNVNSFDLNTAAGGKLYWWWVEDGTLNKKEQ